jgi:sigma-54-specific transcriptional regulator
MSQWLTFSDELVKENKSRQLATKFIHLLNKGMELKLGMLLLPSDDGRFLLSVTDHQYRWSVTDFDVPFSHVLQSRTPMHLTAEDLIFWQANSSFCQLIENVGIFDSVWVQPFLINNSKIQALLLLIGESNIINDVFSDNDFLTFLDAFTQQWSYVIGVEQEGRAQLERKESLLSLQQDSKKHRLINQLSGSLIGESCLMQKLREQILSVVNSQLSVMIQGDTGTGKELVATAIHEFSTRKSAPFVAVNCSAIPEHLLESELFGYCKGAFSGANRDHQGLIAQAHGGTLFLDEIGDMPQTLQAKLLRVIESHRYRPLGGKYELSSDFRLVSATHVNLFEQVRKKTFRQDLYYRLLQYPITLPSLVDRIEDVHMLCDHFVQSFNFQHGTRIRGLSHRALTYLMQYDFPGNVRELKHLVDYGCVQTSDGDNIEPDCFDLRLNTIEPFSTTKGIAVDICIEDVECEQSFAVVNDLKQALNDFEASIITERLTYFSGNRTKAAQSLGIPKRTLIYRCKKLEIME